jgi:hypothetical protein
MDEDGGAGDEHDLPDALRGTVYSLSSCITCALSCLIRYAPLSFVFLVFTTDDRFPISIGLLDQMGKLGADLQVTSTTMPKNYFIC